MAALEWAEQIGGVESLWARADSNLEVIERWVDVTPWVDFLSEREEWRSNTSICLKITAGWFLSASSEKQKEITKGMVQRLESEKVAYDIESYRSAPPGLRIWGGATVEPSDIELLLPWIEWSYRQAKTKFSD